MRYFKRRMTVVFQTGVDLSPGGQRSPADISLLPTKELFSKLGELDRTKRLGEDVSELVFGSDGDNVDDAWFEMFPKPWYFTAMLLERGVILGGSEVARDKQA